MKEGEVITFTVMREDKLREFNVILGSLKKANYKIEKYEDPDDLQESIYNSWLKSASE